MRNSVRPARAGRENTSAKSTRASTGPRTPEGKKRSARNATKHGLSLPVSHDPHLAQEVTELATRIANGNEGNFQLCIPIAEAEIDLLRIRRVRCERIRDAIVRPPMTTREASKYLQIIARISNEDRALRESDVIWMEEYLARKDETEPQRHARALAILSNDLAKLDRYERRALSRRKFAVRRFDQESQR